MVDAVADGGETDASGRTLADGHLPESSLRRILAAGHVGGDLSLASLARAAGVDARQAHLALEWAQAAGLTTPGGATDQLDAWVRELLDPFEVARIHVGTVRHLLSEGPERVDDAIAHARAAGDILVASRHIGATAADQLEELVAMLDRAGRLSLSVGEYPASYRLLGLAAELAGDTDPGAQGARLCDLSQAADGRGDIEESRSLLRRAVALGELSSSAALVARAGVMYALSLDGVIGHMASADVFTTGVLVHAEAMPQSANARVAIAAARAVAEYHPSDEVAPPAGGAAARAAVAHLHAERALSEADQCSSEVQCMAQIAWRSTHRAPAALALRRERSEAALDLAQRIRMRPLQVAAAGWLAMDALEMADRGTFDHAVSVARWVAASDGGLRLRRDALVLSIGAAFVDDDPPRVRRLREELAALGSVPHVPATAWAFALQESIRWGDHAAMTSLSRRWNPTSPLRPVMAAVRAHLCAVSGDPHTAADLLHDAVARVEPEGEYLLTWTRIIAAAAAIDEALAPGDDGLVADLLDQAVAALTPWSERMAVGEQAWWCDGPVALWLAEVAHRRGQDQVAEQFLRSAASTATLSGDRFSLRRVDELRGHIDAAGRRHRAERLTLRPRELEVLELMAEGLNNAEISARLGFSPSTIRADAGSIFRKLAVRSRVAAIAQAVELGLLAPRR